MPANHQISRGQRSKLADVGLGDNSFTLDLSLATGGLAIDAACFGLDSARKLSDERYMTFFNQPASPCGGVRQTSPLAFQFDLNRLPASIDVLVVTLATDSAAGLKGLGASQANLSAGATQAASFAFDGSIFTAERAVMLMEFYRKDGQWRLSPVAQGFQGGLDAVVRHFGGEVSSPSPAPAPAPVAPVPPPPAAPPKVSLSKITLDKRGDKVSLEKRGTGAGHGRIVCNLRWTSGAAADQKKSFLGGLLGKKGRGIDLDLGCLFEMSDGGKSIVQALGNSFGAYDRPPYIHLAGDDRTGSNADGEFIYINGDRLQQIRRICVYAFIYEGVANWAQADGYVTLTVPGHPPVEVRMDGHDNRRSVCAIAMLENSGGELKVTKLAEYFPTQKEMDERYRWGLRWEVGSKD